MKISLNKINTIIAILAGIVGLFFALNQGYIFLKSKNIIFKKDKDLLICIGPMYYKFNEYNVVVGDTFSNLTKNLLVQRFPIRIYNNSENTIKNIEFFVLHKSDIHPSYLGKDIAIIPFDDSKYYSNITADSTYVTKNLINNLNKNQNYNIEKEFIFRHEFTNINFHYISKNNTDTVVNKKLILLRNINFKISANNIEENNKHLLAGKIYADNWEDLMNKYIEQILMLKENENFLLETSIPNRFRLDINRPTFLILNSIEKGKDRNVYFGKVKLSNIRIAIIEDDVLRIVDFDGRILFKLNLKTSKQV